MSSKTKNAFTIVELALSSAFLGILLISIAMLVMRLIAIYQKGLSIRQLNTLSSEIVSTFTSDINNASYTYALYDMERRGEDIVSNPYAEQYELSGSLRSRYAWTVASNETQDYGALCTGLYSYIWNSPAAYAKGLGEVPPSQWQNYYTQENYDSFVSNQDIGGFYISSTINNTSTIYKPRLARILDSGQVACRDLSEEGESVRHEAGYENNYTYGRSGGSAGAMTRLGYQTVKTYSSHAAIITTGTTGYGTRTDFNIHELIDAKSNLALHELNLVSVYHSVDSRQSIFTINFVLGENSTEVDITEDGLYCEKMNTCIMEKFSFSASSGGDQTVR